MEASDVRGESERSLTLLMFAVYSRRTNSQCQWLQATEPVNGRFLPQKRLSKIGC